MTLAAYYNEIDRLRAEWLLAMIGDGMIPEGDVDERDIWDIEPSDLVGYTQCHFFAGVGGWPLALRLAGWPDNRPVWTGSCPCQPFSQAGKGDGFADERHLWPAWFHLISQLRPSVVFGEQVASKLGLGWLDLVQSDLEGAGYACGAFDLCAAGVGAPHVRQRLWFVAERLADNDKERWKDAARRQRPPTQARRPVANPHDAGACGLVLSNEDGRKEGRGATEAARHRSPTVATSWAIHRRMEYSSKGRRRAKAEPAAQEEEAQSTDKITPSIICSWANCEWIECADGKLRPIEPGVRPLAYGLSSPSPAVAAYGDAIVPQVAAEVISAYMGVRP